MQIELTPTLMAVVLSGAITLAGIAAAWGNIRAQLKGLYQLHDATDKRLDSHSERLAGQGQRIAHLEGVLPHSPGGGEGGDNGS